MDTRFWGPSGWKLLHSISFAYNPKDKVEIKTFFLMLPFVLPCKFCRTSLQEYMEIHSLERALESQETLSRWLWKIHNEVNSKLRKQNLAVTDDPPFEKVKEYYESLLAVGCSKTEFPGWDFLFSIAELHPYSKAAKESVPIPGQPCEELLTIEAKNKWNCLTPDERFPLYTKFWNTIGKVLPYKEWRTSWNLAKGKKLITIDRLWKIRCRMENDLKLLNRCKYSSLCRTLKQHRSGCNKSKRAKTCRKHK